jgi:hypothetical protein
MKSAISAEKCSEVQWNKVVMDEVKVAQSAVVSKSTLK